MAPERTHGLTGATATSSARDQAPQKQPARKPCAPSSARASAPAWLSTLACEHRVSSMQAPEAIRWRPFLFAMRPMMLLRSCSGAGCMSAAILESKLVCSSISGHVWPAGMHAPHGETGSGKAPGPHLNTLKPACKKTWPPYAPCMNASQYFLTCVGVIDWAVHHPDFREGCHVLRFAS